MYNPELVCANSKNIYQSQHTSAWICLLPLQNLFSVLPHGKLGVDIVHHNITVLVGYQYIFLSLPESVWDHLKPFSTIKPIIECQYAFATSIALSLPEFVQHLPTCQIQNTYSTSKHRKTHADNPLKQPFRSISLQSLLLYIFYNDSTNLSTQ